MTKTTPTGSKRTKALAAALSEQKGYLDASLENRELAIERMWPTNAFDSVRDRRHIAELGFMVELLTNGRVETRPS